MSYRVLRGGSWNNNANNCRVANRNNNIGFRVCLHFLSNMSRIVWFTDRTSVAGKVLVVVPSWLEQ